MPNGISSADWISAISSLTAAIIGMMTLVTVYIGAMQFLSQSRMYRLGLSWRSLGPWQSTVAKWQLFGLQRRISSPTVSLKFLVQKKWEPSITFPIGFSKKKKECVEEADYVQANASWVNFMQALGLAPDGDLYDIQDASELVNGIVPMHWTGKDLVGVCSILGFQSHEQSPSWSSPMPLPMKWSGPLGWLQFRSSANGCVAEFRRRMALRDQIPRVLHNHYRQRDLPRESYTLRSRLWNSINGFALKDDQTLYLGGTDKYKRPQEVDEESDIKQEEMFQDLTSSDLPDEDIMRKLFGKKEKRPNALQREVERNGPGMTQRDMMHRDANIPDFIDSVLRDKVGSPNRKQIMRPCPGLLSVSVEGELAYNRGLSVENCREYDRKMIEAEDIDHTKCPYNLGDLYMDEDLLRLMKEALLLLRPDGFYFSPTGLLCQDLCEVYEEIQKYSNVCKEIFPKNCIDALLLTQQSGSNEKASDGTSCSFTTNSSSSRPTPAKARNECLYFAMLLCNELQATRKTGRACFSVDDMQLLAKAASTLCSVFLSSQSDNKDQDLVWAVLCCRDLSKNILNALKTVDISEFVAARVTCKNEVLDFGTLLGTERGNDEDAVGQFKVPLVADGEFTGDQVIAAVAVVFITYYWIDKRWITDVPAYDTTMPQSILMC